MVTHFRKFCPPFSKDRHKHSCLLDQRTILHYKGWANIEFFSEKQIEYSQHSSQQRNNR